MANILTSEISHVGYAYIVCFYYDTIRKILRIEVQMVNSKIKLCIVEDYALTRTACKCALSSYKDMEVTADFADAESCIKHLETNQIDIILMDLGLPHMNGLEATQIIKEKYPEIKIIILTSHETDEEVLTALASGANAYSLKDIDFSDLHNVINLVVKGGIWLDPRIVQIAVKMFKNEQQKHTEKDFLGKLTDREKEVLKLLSQGLSNTEIAEKLIISSHTAKVHVSNILSKLAVTDRVQAAVKAYQYNLC